jgi:hypothetical protein
MGSKGEWRLLIIANKNQSHRMNFKVSLMETKVFVVSNIKNDGSIQYANVGAT